MTRNFKYKQALTRVNSRIEELNKLSNSKCDLDFGYHIYYDFDDEKYLIDFIPGKILSLLIASRDRFISQKIIKEHKEDLDIIFNYHK